MTDIAKLKELAKAATPGPWSSAIDISRYDLRHIKDSAGQSLAWTGSGIARGSHPTNGDADAAFIAAANPTAILTLIERLERAEGVLRSIVGNPIIYGMAGDIYLEAQAVLAAIPKTEGA